MASLIVPAFLAGVLTFLAPCTLPLVPGYLGFISGVSLSDVKNPVKAKRVKRKIFLNGVFYVIGFSLVFIGMGSLVGLIGGSLFGQYRALGSRLGGIFVVLFGLVMISSALIFYEERWLWLRSLRLPLISSGLAGEKRIAVGSWIKPGNPFSSIVFGAAFAIGWTPCVGPVLGAILTLASTGENVGQGAILLAVFSLGLAVPFLILAGGIGYFADRLHKLSRFLPLVSVVGGGFIILLGVLVATNRLGLWVSLFFRWFGFINYEQLLNLL